MNKHIFLLFLNQICLCFVFVLITNIYNTNTIQIQKKYLNTKKIFKYISRKCRIIVKFVVFKKKNKQITINCYCIKLIEGFHFFKFTLYISFCSTFVDAMKNFQFPTIAISTKFSYSTSLDTMKNFQLPTIATCSTSHNIVWILSSMDAFRSFFLLVFKIFHKVKCLISTVNC